MENEIKATVLVIAVMFTFSAYAFPQLPEQSASHWNANGEVDGYLPAFWAAFLLPVISVVLFLLMLAIPVIDPLRANIELFRKEFYGFIFVMTLFLAVIHVQTIIWNLGQVISFNTTMPVLFGILFFFLGSFLSKAKQNWFIGVRTPWTLSSEEVWNRTHRLAAKLFKAAGMISVFSIFLPYGLTVMIAVALAAGIVPAVYSYFIFVNMEKK